MISHKWAKARRGRRGKMVDPLAPLELLAMAATASGLASNQSIESISHLSGTSPSVLEMMSPLLQPRGAWLGIRMLLEGSQLSGEDLSELEHLFRGIDKAMSRATARQVKDIRAFSTSLVGTKAPRGGFTELAVQGARTLFVVARLGKHRLLSVPLDGNEFSELRLAGSEQKEVARCWLEAVSLGLLKARLRYVVINSSRSIARGPARDPSAAQSSQPHKNSRPGVEHDEACRSGDPKLSRPG